MSETNGHHKSVLSDRTTFLAGMRLTRNVSLTEHDAIADGVMNAFLSRWGHLERDLDQRRNIYAEAGWKEELTARDYQRYYDRHPIAARVVEVMPKECWQAPPELYETEDDGEETAFEQAVAGLGSLFQRDGTPMYYKDARGNPLWKFMFRAHVAMRIGRYGVVLFGLDDVKTPADLARPVEGFAYPSASVIKSSGVKLRDPLDARYQYGAGGTFTINLAKDALRPAGRKCLFVRCYPESQASVSRWDEDVASPRYGLPVEYLLSSSPNVNTDQPVTAGDGTRPPQGTVAVHWTRVLHLAQDVLSNECLAYPPMQQVMNNLQNIEKVYAASGEAYWKGAFQTTYFSTPKEWGNDVDVSESAFRDMIYKINNGLQRDGLLKGLTPTPVAPTVTDPTPHLLANVQAICIKLGVPQRVFMGSERGELASSQDDASWNDRVGHEQFTWCTPGMLVPFVTRLIQYGHLPPPQSGEFKAEWPDLDSNTDLQRADLSSKRVASLAQYYQSGLKDWMPPLEYFTRYDDMTVDQAEALVAAIEEHEAAQKEKMMADQRAMIDEGLERDPALDQESELADAAFAREETPPTGNAAPTVKALAPFLKQVMDDLTVKQSRAVASAVKAGVLADADDAAVASVIARTAGLDEDRALLVAATEMTRARANALLSDLRPRDKVRFVANAGACAECRVMDGRVFTARKANDLIPVHPGCHCAWEPAAKGVKVTNEFDKNQPRDKDGKWTAGGAGHNMPVDYGPEGMQALGASPIFRAKVDAAIAGLDKKFVEDSGARLRVVRIPTDEMKANGVSLSTRAFADGDHITLIESATYQLDPTELRHTIAHEVAHKWEKKFGLSDQDDDAMWAVIGDRTKLTEAQKDKFKYVAKHEAEALVEAIAQMVDPHPKTAWGIPTEEFKVAFPKSVEYAMKFAEIKGLTKKQTKVTNAVPCHRYDEDTGLCVNCGGKGGKPGPCPSKRPATTLGGVNDADPHVAPEAVRSAALKLARKKIREAPVPSPEKVAAARNELRLAAEGKIRAGGYAGGSSADRKKQVFNLFKEFGGVERGYVACPWTGIKLHWTSDPAENPNGYPKLERGKVFTKCQGGGYNLPNLIPESFTANRARNDKRVRKENSDGC